MDNRIRDDLGYVIMKAMSAIVFGPMCFLVAFAKVHERPWYHPLQLIVSSMQLACAVWFIIVPFVKLGDDVSIDLTFFETGSMTEQQVSMR